MVGLKKEKTLKVYDQRLSGVGSALFLSCLLSDHMEVTFMTK